jgi:hypothetical protein
MRNLKVVRMVQKSADEGSYFGVMIDIVNFKKCDEQIK